MGFELVATKGTAAAIKAAGMACDVVNKVTEGRPHVVDMIKNNEIALVINTVEERRNAIADSRQIRTSALLARVTTFTTIAGAEAAVEGMKYLDNLDVYSVQELHAQLRWHNRCAYPLTGRGQAGVKRRSAALVTFTPETLRDMATIPITKRGAEKLKAELHRLKTVDRPSVINAICRGARPGRPERKRRIRRRQGPPGLHRRPHPGNRGQAVGRPGHRSDRGRCRRQGGVRRHRGAGRRRHRRQR